MRNPTTWFQLGIIGDAGPEIDNGLGAFVHAARGALTRPRSLAGLKRVRLSIAVDVLAP